MELWVAVWVGLALMTAAGLWRVRRSQKQRAAQQVVIDTMRLWAACAPYSSAGVSSLFMEAAVRVTRGEDAHAKMFAEGAFVQHESAFNKDPDEWNQLAELARAGDPLPPMDVRKKFEEAAQFVGSLRMTLRLSEDDSDEQIREQLLLAKMSLEGVAEQMK